MTPRSIIIPKFPGNKRFAVTTSWDDGTIHDRRVVAALNEWGLKGTFNLNSGLLQMAGSRSPGGWHDRIAPSEVASLYAGHEVAIHTVTHPHLPQLDASQIASQVLDDRKALEDLVNYPVRGMAYPYGTYNEQVVSILRALGIVYSRTCLTKENPWPVEEPLLWPTTCHQFVDHPTAAERFQAWVARPESSGLFYIWGHSYEFTEAARSWSDLERIYKPLAGHPETWYCTNIQLFDYEEARQRLRIAANKKSAHNPSAMAVALLIDGKCVDVPPGQTIALE